MSRMFLDFPRKDFSKFLKDFIILSRKFQIKCPL